MRPKLSGETVCPVARALARVADHWSVLILREAFQGVTRFDTLEQNLGIAPNMLTRRLNSLVEGDMLERRRYCDRPPRSEYILTERGRDFRQVLQAMQAWSSKHLVPASAEILPTPADHKNAGWRLAAECSGAGAVRQRPTGTHLNHPLVPPSRRRDSEPKRNVP